MHRLQLQTSSEWHAALRLSHFRDAFIFTYEGNNSVSHSSSFSYSLNHVGSSSAHCSHYDPIMYLYYNIFLFKYIQCGI